jgi:hypothetical protein
MNIYISDSNVVISKYKEGYELLMEYWDSLPDDEKQDIHNKLKKIGL